ncbi:HepT-like ribonuclease domain-containing protein [Luteococcus sp.]
MRNVVIHEYFRIDRAWVEDIVHTQLEALRDVINSRG